MIINPVKIEDHWILEHPDDHIFFLLRGFRLLSTEELKPFPEIWKSSKEKRMALTKAMAIREYAKDFFWP